MILCRKAAGVCRMKLFQPHGTLSERFPQMLRVKHKSSSCFPSLSERNMRADVARYFCSTRADDYRIMSGTSVDQQTGSALTL